MRRSTIKKLLLGALVLAVLASAAAGWMLLDQTRAENARQERFSRLREISDAIRRQGLDGLATMTRDLSRNAPGALSANPDSVRVFLARMEGEMKIGRSDLGFLLDSTGIVRLSRQKPGERGILGRNLSFRRYFKEGKADREDLFAAVGAFTDHRGVYASTPVFSKGRFLGVAVARLGAEEIEKTWLSGTADPLALVSPEGVVLASNQPGWRLATQGVSDSALERLRISRQFGDSIHPMEPDLSRKIVRWNRRIWYVVRTDMGGSWSLVGLLPLAARSPLSSPQTGAAWGVAIAGLLLVLLGILVAMGLGRLGKVERERLQLAKRLDEAERLEALGRLAGGVAHDFNNVLTAIIGYSSVLEHRLEDRPKDQDMARRTGQAARRAAETVHQLMTFARRSDLQVRPIAFHDLVREVAGLLEHTLPRGIRVLLDLQAEHDVVEGDSGHLHQAILNLAVNSRDAMPDGGTLRFSTKDADPSTTVRRLELRVSDDGAGIPPDVLPHVFEPFFTTKSGGRGTGLGLASVWGTVQRHGGSISVESAPGAGTEFVILLPLAPIGVEAVAPARELARRLPRLGARIAALDDDHHVLDALGTMARSLGHHIDLYLDYRSLRTRLESDGIPDLLVLDLDMPDIHGLDVLMELRSEHPGLRVLVASGHVVSETLEDLRRLGVSVFLRKPFGTTDLDQAIDEALRPSP